MSRKIKVVKRFHDLPKPYLVHTIKEIREQSARGTAVAGGALLDLILRQIIEHRLIKGDNSVLTDLFENRGPLQDFSARIQMAYAMGLIGWRACADLVIIRDIRNAFAHSADAFDFDLEDVAHRCKLLWFAQAIQYGKRPEPATPHEIFIREVELLADLLTDSIHPRFAGSKLPHMIQMGPPRPQTQQQQPKKPRIRGSRGRSDPEQETEVARK